MKILQNNPETDKYSQKQVDWQETDISDGQESPHLNQLTQLIAKTGFQIVVK